MTEKALALLILIVGILIPAGDSVRAQTAPVPAADPLIIATRHTPPFAIKTGRGWDGITIELVRRIAAEGGLRYEFREMGLEEMLDAVVRDEVTAAAAALTITSEREQRLDFTHPFFTSGLGVAVSKRQELTWYLALQRVGYGAFVQSLAALLGILTLLGVLVWLAERKRNGQFPRHPVEGIGAGIWWSAVTVTTVGYGDKAPITLVGRIIGLIWMFASIVVISGFTASIASSLTVSELDQSVSRVEDLYGKRILTVPGSTSAAFLDNKLIRDRNLPTATEALDELASGQADAVVYDIPILRYLVNEYHAADLRVLPNQFARQDYGIALPPLAPLREALNQQILRIIGTPEWALMLEGYLGPEG